MKSFFDPGIAPATTLDVSALPLYLDGYGGSIWLSRDGWQIMLTDGDMASRRFVRVSDLLALLAANGISVCGAPADSKP